MELMYFTLFLKNLKVRFIYRFDVLLGMISSFCFFIIRIIVWKALYMGKETISGVSLEECILYAMASSIITALMASRVGETIGNNVYQGIISIDFIRPIGIKKFYLAQDLSNVIYNSINALILAIIISFFYSGVTSGIIMINLIKFVISLILAIVLNYQLVWLLGLTSFWFQTGWHIRWVTNALIKTFSGTVLPLWFYPEWMLAMSKVLPYRYIYYDPIAFLMGNNTESFARVCLIQCIWIIGISIIECFVWKRAKNKLIVQGG